MHELIKVGIKFIFCVIVLYFGAVHGHGLASLIFLAGFFGRLNRRPSREKIEKDQKWQEFNEWKANYQTNESKTKIIEGQWQDFDAWKTAQRN